MNPTAGPTPVVHFGLFEVDLRTGELRKQGLKIKLHGQPMEVLEMLLEHPGDLVTREEIQKRLWPAETFVDFETGLNQAVKKLREALGDHADNPRFVETLPRKGYRFVALVHRPHLAPVPKIESIAVLPLENLSRDPEQEYFADGMTEELITNLGKIRALRVISRTSVMQYKKTAKPLPQIAQELNVDAVVEGSVVHSGGRVRITAQLLHAPTDRHLWADSFESSERDVLILQGEMAQRITREINSQVTPEERGRLTATSPVNPDAYKAYLKGSHLLGDRRSPKEDWKAIKYFQEAVKKEPGYARAYASLATRYSAVAFNSYPSEPEYQNEAVALARRALELDDSLAEPYTVLGQEKYFVDWDWSGGLAMFRRAVELEPNNAVTSFHYAWGLELLGRFYKAIPLYECSLRLDPVGHFPNLFMATALYNAHQDERALGQFRRVLGLEPSNRDAYPFLGVLYEAMGRDQEAIAAYIKGATLAGESAERVRSYREAYKTGGIRGYWKKRLDDLKTEAKSAKVSPFLFAYYFAHAGDNERAMAWLEMAYKERTAQMVFLKCHRSFDPLRSDPRFQDLLLRMNFPP